jgi:hypothetical protein
MKTICRDDDGDDDLTPNASAFLYRVGFEF